MVVDFARAHRERIEWHDERLRFIESGLTELPHSYANVIPAEAAEIYLTRFFKKCRMRDVGKSEPDTDPWRTSTLTYDGDVFEVEALEDGDRLHVFYTCPDQNAQPGEIAHVGGYANIPAQPRPVEKLHPMKQQIAAAAWEMFR